MSGPDGNHGNEHLSNDVRRRRDRRERWQREGERPLGRNLALVGSLGWAIVLPGVGGLFLGRWLDGGVGAFWTISLLVGGLGAGCWMAWERIRQEER
ncbi:AtpZ/AtpI family protein [Rhodocista pekingensis]|uniref:AtpZ/AtpI family protein n=1 Tax=Rhodocista pekingensis TaxID=201185 RepID=A0ABW2KV69_9PROT